MIRKYLDKHGFNTLVDIIKKLTSKVWHGTREAWDALSAEEQDKYDQAEIIDDPDNSGLVQVVDKVEEGNMNPVTSNAVAEAGKYLEDVEVDTGKTWIHGEKIYRLVHKVVFSATEITQTFPLSSIIKGNKITRLLEAKLSLNHVYNDGHTLAWYGSNYQMANGTLDVPEIRVRADVGGTNPYIQIKRPAVGWWGGSTEQLRTHYAVIEYCKDESAYY